MSRRTVRTWALGGAVSALLGSLVVAAAAQSDARELPPSWQRIANAIEAEQARAMTLRLPGEEPPYYSATSLAKVHSLTVQASGGALMAAEPQEVTVGRIALRVGSHELDNSNFASDRGGGFFEAGPAIFRLPMDDERTALRRALWVEFDRRYRDAAETLQQKRTARASAALSHPAPADFLRADVSSIVGGPPVALPAMSALRQVAVLASSRLGDAAWVDESLVTVNAWTVEQLHVSTEGARSLAASSFVEVRVEAALQAPDGMLIDDVEDLFLDPTAPGQTQEAALSAVDRVLAGLRNVEERALASDYSGPVLFEETAAPQIVYDVLSPLLSGSPPADLEEPTWGRKLGKRVLPTFLSASDDPTVATQFGQAVMGHYLFDDQGVPPERVSLVEAGRLRALLMSRAPNHYAARSTGHARAGLSGWPRAHIGNLIVENHAALGEAALRKRLLATAAEQGLPYGLVVRAMEPRGFASGGASPPRLLRVLQLNQDGSEVPLRGAVLSEVTARDLRDIQAAGAKPTVVNVRLETGALPLLSTVTAPALLFEEVEVRLPTTGHPLPRRIPKP